MGRRNKKNKIAGIVLGPALALLALSALWKNETRYDYYHAAKGSAEISALGDAVEQQVISYTGAMDKSLTLKGKYIQSFSGYLVIQRRAEIYCWNRSEDDEGHVSWRLKWMNGVESNSRNSGTRQRLSSGRLIPDSYRVDGLEVIADKIEFVDSFKKIPPTGSKTDSSVSQSLVRQANYLMLRKNRGQQLGDERISFSGLPVPQTATWFGKYAGGKGVAHDDNERNGFLNGLIQDTGILHHLVVGDRTTALATTKQYLSRLKWIVRAAGTFATYLGFQFFFSSIVSFVYGVPVIGWLAEKGTFILAFVLGVPLAVVTIVCGYLFGHLYLLLFLLASLFAFACFLVGSRKQSKKVAQHVHQKIEKELGRSLDFNDIKEMEFAELAHLALANDDVSDEELAFLYKWGKQNGWKQDKVDGLLQEVRQVRVIPDSGRPSDWHLNQLIQLSLADGYLSPYEMRTIRDAAKKAGFDRQTVDDLMTKVQQSAAWPV